MGQQSPISSSALHFLCPSHAAEPDDDDADDDSPLFPPPDMGYLGSFGSLSDGGRFMGLEAGCKGGPLGTTGYDGADGSVSLAREGDGYGRALPPGPGYKWSKDLNSKKAAPPIIMTAARIGTPMSNSFLSLSDLLSGEGFK